MEMINFYVLYMAPAGLQEPLMNLLWPKKKGKKKKNCSIEHVCF